MGLIDNVDLVAMLHWAVADSFTNLFNVCDTTVACRIELNDIDTVTRRNPAAGFALITRLGDIRVS
jgi:hypothetical protein